MIKNHIFHGVGFIKRFQYLRNKMTEIGKKGITTSV